MTSFETIKYHGKEYPSDVPFRKIAYDVPQIYAAHNAKTEEKYISLLEETKPSREFIGGVHPWGKSISSTSRKVAHCGDLNSYFGDPNIKEHFLLPGRWCWK